MADNLTLDFVQPDLVVVLDRFALFFPLDNVRVRLKDAHQLVAGRDCLALKDPPLGLSDDL
jgi:hypothetical protein